MGNDRIILDSKNDFTDGDLFFGTRNQFRDCFFDNATDEEILDFAVQENCGLMINGIIIYMENI